MEGKPGRNHREEGNSRKESQGGGDREVGITGRKGTVGKNLREDGRKES